MEILGIGPLELVFILIIALIILGPGDMVKAGRMLGRMLRKVVTSPEWLTIQKASRELKYLPNRLMREASLEDLTKDFDDLNKIGNDIHKEVRQVQSDLTSWTTPPDLLHIGDPAVEQSPDTAQVPAADPAPDPTHQISPTPISETPAIPDSEIKTD
jgi:sec-independent protein translocase protein TatB